MVCVRSRRVIWLDSGAGDKGGEMRKSAKLSTIKFQVDEQIREQIDRFQAEFQGKVPIVFLMPFLVLLGMSAYKRGFRLESEIRLT